MNIITDKWLSVSMQSDKVAKIKIHGVIGGGFFEDGVTDAQVEADLEAIKEIKANTIEVDLDSLGGSVKHGMKIYNLLKSNNAKVVVNITGWCASMGTVISQAGDEIRMVDNSFFLIHEARTFSIGTSSQLESDAKFLKEINNQIANIYAKRTGKSSKEMLDLMAVNGGEGEFWNAKKAKQLGFVDTIYKPENQSKAAALLTDEQLNQFKIKAKINLNNQTMKINLKEVGNLIKGAFNAAFGTLPKEDQTPENIEALLSNSTELVVEMLQKDVDAYKEEQTAKFDELQAKYDALLANPSEPKGKDAGVDANSKLTDADLAAKAFIAQLSETDKLLTTKN